MSNDKDNFSVADLTAALKDEDRAGLVNALKNLAGQRSDVLENLPPKVRKRVDALRDVQGQHDELEAKFREERALLEAKYQKLYQPLYTKLCLHLIPAMVAAISVTGPENVPSHLKPQFIELKLLEEGEVGKDHVTFRSKLELPVQMVFEKWRLRFVFRQLTRCKYEPLLNILLTMPEGPAGEDMKDLMLELCLMFPARLSSLLPYLPCLMKALVFCLKGSDEFVSLGLRSLEFWVDNLNHDFLEPNVVNVMSEVTLLLWSHLRLVPHPCYKKALQWKLGGRKHPPFQKEPLTLECKYVKSQSATCCLYLCFKSFGSKTLLSDTYDEFVENSCRNFAVILHVDYSSSNASTSTSSLGGSVILASSKSKSIQSSNSKQSNPLILLDVLVDVLANENWVHAKAVLNVLNVLAETFLFLARVKHADVLMGRGGHNASIIVSSPSTNSVYSTHPSVVSRTGSEETELLEPSYQLLLQPLILRPLRCKTVEQQVYSEKQWMARLNLRRNIKHFKAKLHSMQAVQWRRSLGISIEGDGELLAATKVKPVTKRDEWMTTLLLERKARVAVQQSTSTFSRNAREGRKDTTIWTGTHMDKAQRGKINQRHIGPRLLVLLAWTSSAEATKQGKENLVSDIWIVVIMFACLLPLVYFMMRFLWRSCSSNPEHASNGQSGSSNPEHASNEQSSSSNPEHASNEQSSSSNPEHASNGQSGSSASNVGGSGVGKAKPKRKQKKKGSMLKLDTPDLLKDSLVSVEDSETQDGGITTVKAWEGTTKVSLSDTIIEERKDLKEDSETHDGGITTVYTKAWKGTTKVSLSDTIIEERKDLKVFEGYLQDRPVFVKCGDRSDEMNNEIAILIAADSHPNIIRYFCFEEMEKCFSYCLEPWMCNLLSLVKFCDGKRSSSRASVLPEETTYVSFLETTLGQHSLWTAAKAPSTLLINLIRDVVLGIEHLHKLKIIHRDLRPENVMIMYNGKTLIAKIDDMGIARAENKPFLPPRVRDEKSEVFQPAEQIDEEEYTTAVDMFALGCLMFHCVSSGKHPFGSEGGVSKQKQNILKNCCDLRAIKTFPEAHDLVQRLVNVKPNSRPSASEVLLHPFFWNDDVKRDFIKVVSNNLGKSGLESELNKVATVANALGDASWFTKLPRALLEHLDPDSARNHNAASTSYIHTAKTYDGTRLSDLIKVIRNKEEHYNTLPRDIKHLFQNGVYIYFDRMFPNVLMVVYNIVYGVCKNDVEFRGFFKEIARFKIVEM